MKINEIVNLKVLNTNKLFERKSYQLDEPNTSDGKRPGDDQVATLIGPNAKTYDMKKEKLARKMEKQGYSRNEIWYETGTVRNSNGDWRQEISDRGIRIKKGNFKVGKDYKFSDIIDHKELYKAYPFLKDYTINLDNEIDADGQWNPNNKTITIHPDHLERFTATHELQHAVQYTEKPEDVKYMGTNNDIKKKLPHISSFEIYKMFHKEMDARTAENRIDYEDWKLKLNVPTNTDTEMMTIQDRPKTGPQYDMEFDVDNDLQKKYNPQKTVPNPHFKDIGGDDWKNDPMQKSINKHIRGNVPKNMKAGDIGPGKSFKHSNATHTHPKQSNATPTNIPKPRPANLGKDQTTTTVKPKPRPANLGNQVK